MAARNQAKEAEYKFWKSGNHAIELYSEKFVREKIRYIHNNPVKAQFVVRPEHWIFSSASKYCGLECVLPDVKVRSEAV